MDDALVEKVARALLMAHCEDMNPPGTDNAKQVDNEWPDWVPEARAVIPVVAEHCAGVAERMMMPSYDVHTESEAEWNDTCDHSAAAIRRETTP